MELVEGEEARLTGLSWPAGDELAGKNVVMRHAGKKYLSHRADGSCVYLNLQTNRCRVHEAFGANVKPAGCRLFPFNLVKTFDTQVTVTARYECPSVQKNVGAEQAQAAAELMQLLKATGAGPGFDERVTCMLEQEQVEAIAGFASAMLGTFASDAQKAMFLYALCEWLSSVRVGELDREMLARAYPTIRGAVEGIDSSKTSPPGAAQRLAFRTLWAMYLRRDEDVLNKRAGRVSRAAALARVSLLGWGGMTSLGLKNPQGSIRRAKLFSGKRQPVEPGAFATHWRMVRNKLDSLQFMGSANHNKNMLEGIRSLALLYPLVCATARARAGDRAVNEVDVRSGVAAIEHAFGRAPMLALGPAQMLEGTLLEAEAFVRVVAWV